MSALVEYFGREYFDQLFYTFVTVLIVTAAYFDLRDKNYPPGPFGMPFFGYLPMLNPKMPYKTLKDLAQHYGKVYGFYLGKVYTVVISDVKLIREAFAMESFHEKAPLILANEIADGKGILMAEHSRWKKHRFFLESAMKTLSSTKTGSGSSPQVILEEKIQQSLTDFIQEMREKVGSGGGSDIRPSLRHSIGSLMFDVVTGIRPERADSQWNRIQSIFTAQLESMSITSSTNFVPILKNFSKYTKAVGNLISGKHEANQVYKKCAEKYEHSNSGDFRCLIEAYISEMKGRKNCNENDEDFSTEQVTQIILDTLAMGWETTLNSVQWLFIYLAMYPEVQEDIVKEMDYVLGASRDNLSLEQCKKLKYAEAVIMEVWRHRPVLPMGLPHCAAENSKIGSYRIPEGTLVVPLIYAVHRDQRYWDKPDEFIPERHLNDDGSIKKSDYFIPFQTGKRTCLGEELAQWTIILFLIGVMNRYKVSFAPGVKYSNDDLPDFSVSSVPPSYRLLFDARQ